MIIQIINGLARETAGKLVRRRQLLAKALETRKFKSRSATDAAYLVKQIDFEMLFRK